MYVLQHRRKIRDWTKCLQNKNTKDFASGFRNTCGGQWKVQIRRILALRSTFVGK